MRNSRSCRFAVIAPRGRRYRAVHCFLKAPSNALAERFAWGAVGGRRILGSGPPPNERRVSRSMPDRCQADLLPHFLDRGSQIIRRQSSGTCLRLFRRLISGEAFQNRFHAPSYQTMRPAQSPIPHPHQTHFNRPTHRKHMRRQNAQPPAPRINPRALRECLRHQSETSDNPPMHRGPFSPNRNKAGL
jgi:hypothetical protein